MPGIPPAGGGAGGIGGLLGGIVPAIGGLLGSSSSSIGGGALLGGLGSLLDFGLGSAAQADAQDFAKFVLRNRYQLTVRDLEKAGLNPILALRGGLTAGGGGVGPGVSTRTDLTGSAARAAQAQLHREGIRTQQTQQSLNTANMMLASSAANVRNAEAREKAAQAMMAELRTQYFLENPTDRNRMFLGETTPKSVPEGIMRLLLGAQEGVTAARDATTPEALKQQVKDAMDEFFRRDF